MPRLATAALPPTALDAEHPMFLFLRSYLPSHERAHAWLRRHPWIEQALERTGCLHVHRRTVARGVAIGVFVGLTPTVGMQTVLMLIGCVAVRGNFPAAFLASWISNPITLGPLYFAFNGLGETVFGGVIGPEITISGRAEGAAVGLIYMVLGSLLIAGPVAIAAYLLSIWTWRLLVVRRRRHALKARYLRDRGEDRPAP